MSFLGCKLTLHGCGHVEGNYESSLMQADINLVFAMAK